MKNKHASIFQNIINTPQSFNTLNEKSYRKQYIWFNEYYLDNVKGLEGTSISDLELRTLYYDDNEFQHFVDSFISKTNKNFTVAIHYLYNNRCRYLHSLQKQGKLDEIKKPNASPNGFMSSNYARRIRKGGMSMYHRQWFNNYLDIMFKSPNKRVTISILKDRFQKDNSFQTFVYDVCDETVKMCHSFDKNGVNNIWKYLVRNRNHYIAKQALDETK